MPLNLFGNWTFLYFYNIFMHLKKIHQTKMSIGATYIDKLWSISWSYDIIQLFSPLFTFSHLMITKQFDLPPTMYVIHTVNNIAKLSDQVLLIQFYPYKVIPIERRTVIKKTSRVLSYTFLVLSFVYSVASFLIPFIIQTFLNQFERESTVNWTGIECESNVNQT